MGRIEKRMYRRARVRRRRVWLAAAALVLIVAAAAAVFGRGGLQAQVVPSATGAPKAAFDRSAQEREITLEQQTWYAIQTGIYSAEQAAREHAGTYADRGAPGYIARDGERWRVFIACYGGKDDASAVRERLSAQQGVDTYLHTWVCPEITLRLSGMAGQVDVAEAGLTLMLNAAVLLRDNAAMLDGGGVAQEDVRSLIAGLDGQIYMWCDAARSRFARPYPELIASTLAEADAWKKRYAAITAADTATALSAEMKLQAMAIYDACCAMRREMMQ